MSFRGSSNFGVIILLSSANPNITPLLANHHSCYNYIKRERYMNTKRVDVEVEIEGVNSLDENKIELSVLDDIKGVLEEVLIDERVLNGKVLTNDDINKLINDISVDVGVGSGTNYYYNNKKPFDEIEVHSHLVQCSVHHGQEFSKYNYEPLSSSNKDIIKISVEEAIYKQNVGTENIINFSMTETELDENGKVVQPEEIKKKSTNKPKI